MQHTHSIISVNSTGTIGTSCARNTPTACAGAAGSLGVEAICKALKSAGSMHSHAKLSPKFRVRTPSYGCTLECKPAELLLVVLP
jgi:hypothetical protein